MSYRVSYMILFLVVRKERVRLGLGVRYVYCNFFEEGFSVTECNYWNKTHVVNRSFEEYPDHIQQHVRHILIK